MKQPSLKVCGVNDAAFAAEAARRGVDFLGLIFAAKSPRCVTPDAAKAIRAAACSAAGEASPRFVGVFVDAPVGEIARIAESVPLDVVQLHGPYSDGDIGELRRLSSVRLEVWRLLGDTPGAEDAVLLDGRDGAKSGGTGRRADWSLVPGLKRRGLRVVLAGGLSADSIAAAAATGADVLDVNSSLETAPGKKSVSRLAELLDRCRAAKGRVARRAFVDSLPVLMGYTTMGFVAGVLLAAKGNVVLAPLWGFLSSALWITGTMSIAGVPEIARRVPVLAFAAMTLAVNFRYAFYGFTMLKRWKDVPLLRKAYLILMLTDENYALEAACPLSDPAENTRYCTILSALNHSYWVAGVVVGALAVFALGQVVSPERIRAWTNGMEFSMAALFLVILTDQARAFAERSRA